MKRIAPLALLLACSLAQASTADSFKQVLQETAASPTRTVTFFHGLSELEEGVVSGAALKDALREGGVPAGGLLGAFLDGLERVEKSGSRVILQRAEEVTVDTGSGFVKLGKRVEITVEGASATHARLVDLEGARAGKSSGATFPIRTLGLSVDANKVTTAKLDVGYALFSKTVEIVLAKTPKPATHGLTSALAGSD